LTFILLSFQFRAVPSRVLPFPAVPFGRAVTEVE